MYTLEGNKDKFYKKVCAKYTCGIWEFSIPDWLNYAKF